MIWWGLTGTLGGAALRVHGEASGHCLADQMLLPVTRVGRRILVEVEIDADVVVAFVLDKEVPEGKVAEDRGMAATTGTAIASAGATTATTGSAALAGENRTRCNSITAESALDDITVRCDEDGHTPDRAGLVWVKTVDASSGYNGGPDNIVDADCVGRFHHDSGLWRGQPVVVGGALRVLFTARGLRARALVAPGTMAMAVALGRRHGGLGIGVGTRLYGVLER